MTFAHFSLCFPRPLGRNFGYVKYAAQESAEKAMEVLHGQELCGQRMKVVEAEPPKERDNGESARKRPRT